MSGDARVCVGCSFSLSAFGMGVEEAACYSRLSVLSDIFVFSN
jgi:hypothetical protein